MTSQKIIITVLFAVFCCLYTDGSAQPLLINDDALHTVQFDINDKVQEFKVPDNFIGRIYFEALGGDGGKKTKPNGTVKGKGGQGAKMGAWFEVGFGNNKIPPGATVLFIIGEQGQNLANNFANGAGGGGGTAVFYQQTDNKWTLLMVAGGGGGGYGDCCAVKKDGSPGKVASCVIPAFSDYESFPDLHCTFSNVIIYDYCAIGGSAIWDASSMTFTDQHGNISNCYSAVCHYGRRGWPGATALPTSPVKPTGGEGGVNTYDCFDFPIQARGGFGFGGGEAGSGIYDPNSSGGGYTSWDNTGGGSYINDALALSSPAQVAVERSTTSNPQNGTVTYRLESLNDPPNAVCNNLTVHINTNSQVVVTAASLAISSSDPDGDDLTFTVSENGGPLTTSLSFNCNDLGSNPVTVQVSDEYTSSTCNATIWVQDDLAPVARCKSDIISLEFDMTGQAELAAHQVNNGSTDNCFSPSLSVDPNTFDCNDLGLQTVTLTVSDSQNNTDHCTATVSISEKLNSVLGCKDATIFIGEYIYNEALLLTSQVLDYFNPACDNPTFFFVQPNAFGCPGIGNQSVTLSAVINMTDTLTCTAQVTVVDNIPPVPICVNTTVQLNSNDTYTLNQYEVFAGGYDNCIPSDFDEPVIFQSLSQSFFDCSDAGTIVPVLVTVHDGNGNTGTCTAQVLVQEFKPPTVMCKSATVQLNEVGTYVVTAADVFDGGTDNCPHETESAVTFLSVNPEVLGCGHVGTNIVTVTATDYSGNTNTCTAQVLVEDNELPVPLCQDITVFIGTNGQRLLQPDDVYLGGTDNCGVPNFQAISPSLLDCSAVGSTTEVTVTVTDSGGNIGTCAAQVQVEDNLPPIPQCQTTTVQLDPSGQYTLTENDVLLRSTDNCPSESTGSVIFHSIDLSVLDCSHAGNTVPISVQVVDFSGNLGYCTAQITIMDNQPPIPECKNTTVQLNESDQYIVSESDLLFGISDNCNQSFFQAADMVVLDCGNVGNNIVTATVIDGQGNTGTCTAQITVEDHLPPIPECQDATVQLNANGQYQFVQTDILQGGTDNCGAIFFQSTSISALDCNDEGIPTPVTITVHDGHGNTGICSALITAMDALAPNIQCQDITIQLNEGEDYTLSATDIFLSGSDNCGTLNYQLTSSAVLNCNDVGSSTVVGLTATDSNGNSTICLAQVSVGGLPCGWVAPPDGINCPGKEATFDAALQAFSVTSEGCYDPNYYSLSDQHAYAGTQFCGNGEIIAHISEVIGVGWAGISMRENLSPGAKALALSVDGDSYSKRSFRANTNNYAYAQLFPTNGMYWLRLSRIDNQFIAFHSSDGINWVMVFTSVISMPECIEVGLFTTNGASNGQITGTFESVSIGGSLPLAVPIVYEDVPESNQLFDFSLFPNPASDQVQLRLEPFIGRNIQVSVYNHMGQMVLQQQWGTLDESIQTIEVGQLTPGAYIVEVISGDQRISKKLLVNRS